MEPALLLVLFIASILNAQTPAAVPIPTPISVYTAPGISNPELLPTVAAKPYVSDHCRSTQEGKVTFSIIVDSDGIPRNIYFLKPIGDDLDAIALKHVIDDRFKPGTQNGKPVAVAASIELSLRACLRDEKDGQNKTQMILHLAAEPLQRLLPPVDPPKQVVLVSGTGLLTNPSDPEAGVYKVGRDVTFPVLFPPDDAMFRLEGRLLRGGDYKISILVDRYGMPSSFRILDSEPGKSEQLANIVRLRRFKPALLNGEPVPARYELHLHFR